jgi:predicted nuclease of restriction endonuclease-like (RecB) superfamily
LQIEIASQCGLWEIIMSKSVSIDKDYKEWLVHLKARIRHSQIKASVRVNTEMLELYWSIGADIVERQAEGKWGSGIIKKLSQDICDEFPDMQGFSRSNLQYMRGFYLFYRDAQLDAQPLENTKSHQVGGILETSAKSHQVGGELDSLISDREKNLFPQILGRIPWRHHIEIFSRCKTVDEAFFYISKTIENGWSRAVLLNFIKADLFAKQGKALNNFATALPKSQSDVTGDILKDPYNFNFIAMTEKYKEKELEDALTDNITKFLLELGQGFSYYGRQVPLVVDGEEFALDLLFYHVKLHCYIAIELKAGKFNPRDLGQLGFYVSAVNHLHKTKVDQPTVGLLICSEKNNVVAQYALEGSTQPIGISEYELANLIPEDYKSALPSIEEIEEELNDIEE